VEAKVGAGLTAGVVAEYGKFAWPGRDWREFDSGPGSRLRSAAHVLLHQNGADFPVRRIASCALEAIGRINLSLLGRQQRYAQHPIP